MRYLALVTRKSSIREEEFAPYLEPEAERVRELYTSGIVRQAHGRGDVKGAVLELECESLDEAHKALATLPFAAQKFIDVQVVPLLPYRGFAPRNK